MFVRFVQLKIKPDAAVAFERFYDHRVAPALLELNGCIFARLIRGDTSPPEFISFTLWESQESAAAYESSGYFEELISENEPFEADSSEWKIQLSQDMTLEYIPVKEKPSVKGMPIVAGSNEEDSADRIGSHTYIRILSARLAQGKFAELKKLYDETMTPRVLEQDGCRAAYLIGSEGSEEVLSVTIWDEKARAEEYEKTGKFIELFSLATPYLSSLVQWKMSLDPAEQSKTRTSDDYSVKGYHIVSGEKVQNR